MNQLLVCNTSLCFGGVIQSLEVILTVSLAGICIILFSASLSALVLCFLNQMGAQGCGLVVNIAFAGPCEYC